eukprot:scaffold7366_cov254-Pinguiococcus_pyrenoidosus.AAC.11
MPSLWCCLPSGALLGSLHSASDWYPTAISYPLSSCSMALIGAALLISAVFALNLLWVLPLAWLISLFDRNHSLSPMTEDLSGTPRSREAVGSCCRGLKLAAQGSASS